MVEHSARIDVDHVGRLADGDGRQDQVDFTTAWSVGRLVVREDTIVDLEPTFGPSYLSTYGFIVREQPVRKRLYNDYK